MMKKIIFFIIFLLIFSISFAQQIPKGSIGIYSHQNKLMGTMTIAEYEILIKSAKLYCEELKAEYNKRIKITVKENPYIFKIGATYTADISIIWLDEKNNKIKEMIIENSLTIKKENFNIYRVWYRDISEIGFPTLFLVIIFIIIL